MKEKKTVKKEKHPIMTSPSPQCITLHVEITSKKQNMYVQHQIKTTNIGKNQVKVFPKPEPNQK